MPDLHLRPNGSDQKQTDPFLQLAWHDPPIGHVKAMSGLFASATSRTYRQSCHSQLHICWTESESNPLLIFYSQINLIPLRRHLCHQVTNSSWTSVTVVVSISPMGRPPFISKKKSSSPMQCNWPEWRLTYQIPLGFQKDKASPTPNPRLVIEENICHPSNAFKENVLDDP